MDSEKVIARDNNYVLHTYNRNPIVLENNRNPIVLEKGHGLHAYGPEGQSYLDFTSGIGVNSLGYCDLEWAEAVSRQAHKLQHTSNLYYTAPCSKLAKNLCRRTGMSKVFFANSGAEANEGAIKAARKYSHDRYGDGRSTVITLVNSFHGRTLATLTATGQAGFHQYFGPVLRALQRGLCLRGRRRHRRADQAGHRPHLRHHAGAGAGRGRRGRARPPLCPPGAQPLRRKGPLPVGRTGTFLACEQYNLRPDIVTLAKGLGGGLPIGAVLVSDKVAAGMGPGTHGSTFGGNPVVCAGANVVLSRLDERFLAGVREHAAQLRAGLEKLPHVTEVSGLGLMVGVQFEEGIQAADVLAACRERGLLVLTAKTRLRLLPPLVVTAHDIERALVILDEVLCGMDPLHP